MRRRGVTMAEIMIATAIMVLSLLVAYGLLEREFEWSAGLARKVQARELMRTLMQRIASLPHHEMVNLVPEDAELTLEDLVAAGVLEPWVLEGPFQVQLERRPIPGERRVAQLGVVVDYTDTRGRPARLRRSRLVLNDAFGTGGDLKDASGFAKAGRYPGWGRARSWPTSPDPDDRRTPNAVAEAGRRAAEEPPPPDQEFRFRGDPEVSEQLMGEGGEMARPGRSAASARRNRDARARSRFYARSGGRGGRPPVPEEIPDGTYLYLLDVHPAGDSLLGVYHLRGETGNYRLLAHREEAGEVALRRLEGDPVLQRLARVDDGATPWLLERTAHRLYWIELGGEPLERRLVIRTLEAPDPEAEGTRMTRRQRTRAEDHMGLAALDGEPGDPVDRAASPEGGCADGTGTCRVRAVERELESSGL